MPKKAKTQMIWQAGVDAFAARRRKVELTRAARSAAEGVARVMPQATPRLVGGDGGGDEQLRHAVLAATLPLRGEIDALKSEVAQLRRELARLAGPESG